MTIIQNARTSGGGHVSLVPTQAATVGPVETWKAEKVSIWHAGTHDNPFGMRLTTLMISKRIPDSAVPMSLLADHPNVQFNFFRTGIGTVASGDALRGVAGRRCPHRLGGSDTSREPDETYVMTGWRDPLALRSVRYDGLA